MASWLQLVVQYSGTQPKDKYQIWLALSCLHLYYTKEIVSSQHNLVVREMITI